MLILRPRASRMAPKEAEAMPLPSEETTPPVTKTNRFMMGHRRLNAADRLIFKERIVRRSQGNKLEYDGSSDYQNTSFSTMQKLSGVPRGRFHADGSTRAVPRR